MIKGRKRSAQDDTGSPGADAGTIAAVAVMALTIVAGVGVVLLLPRPHPPSPLELSRPAPITHATLPTWLAPRPEPRLATVAQAPSIPGPASPAAEPPPLRERRLETAPVSRVHAPKPRVIAARTTERPTTLKPSECRAPASAADRLVCNRPELAAQERALKRAYDRALAAGADRLAVDRAQARWRGERDRTIDAGELSRLYARRIAELDMAARKAGRRRIYG